MAGVGVLLQDVDVSPVADVAVVDVSPQVFIVPSRGGLFQAQVGLDAEREEEGVVVVARKIEKDVFPEPFLPVGKVRPEGGCGVLAIASGEAEAAVEFLEPEPSFLLGPGRDGWKEKEEEKPPRAPSGTGKAPAAFPGGSARHQLFPAFLFGEEGLFSPAALFRRAGRDAGAGWWASPPNWTGFSPGGWTRSDRFPP